MSEFTYKKVFVRYSQSSMRGYCRPKFVTIRTKKKRSILDKIDEVIPISSMHPLAVLAIVVGIFLATAIFLQWINSLINHYT